MKGHKRVRSTWICMFAILVVIGIFSMVLYYTIDSDSTSEYIVNINLIDETLSDDAGINLQLKEVDYWVNDEGMETECIGAEYSGIIKNDLMGDVFDWKLVVELPSDALIDKFTDGTYSVEGNKLIITPNENTNSIEAGERKTFGFVILSKERIKLEKVQFVGYRHTVLQQYKLFWGLLVAFGLWIIVAASIVISDVRIRHFNQLRENDAKIISQTMKVFAEFIDAKDTYTKGHSVRVAHYAKEIGRCMRMSEDEVVKLEYIGLMHDCGKIGVPDEVLTKPQGLESDECMKIKEHTIMGGKILEGFTAIKGIRDGALYHHECYDGSGYPEGLKGKDIPLCARIICVADAYDAMSTNRCYRNRLTQEDIVRELDAGRGTQFDPEVVTHMINMIDEGCCQLDDNY